MCPPVPAFACVCISQCGLVCVRVCACVCVCVRVCVRAGLPVRRLKRYAIGGAAAAVLLALGWLVARKGKGITMPSLSLARLRSLAGGAMGGGSAGAGAGGAGAASGAGSGAGAAVGVPGGGSSGGALAASV